MGRPAELDADPGDLLVRHRDGDASAFAQLVERYRRPVYSYLARCGIDAADRDDVFQAVFLRIHRSAAQYLRDRPAHPWIFTVVANEVRTHLRRRRVRQLVFGADSPPDPPDAAPDPERATAARQRLVRLEQALAALPLAQREVVVLAGFEGMPLADVGGILGLPLNTVKTHLRRGRLELARRLSGSHP